MRNLLLFSLVAGLCSGCAQAPSVQLALTPAVNDPFAVAFAPAIFSSGAIIKKVAVAHGAIRVLWNTDGSPTHIMEFDQFRSEWFGYSAKAIVASVQSPKDLDRPTIVIRDFNQKNVGNPMEITGPNPHDPFKLGTWLVVAEGIPGTQESIDISIGIASGPWQTLGVYELVNGRLHHKSGSKSEFFIHDDSPDYPPQTLTIYSRLGAGIRDREFRYLVKDRRGIALHEYGSSSWEDASKPSEYRFRGKRSEIRTIKLQSRKFEWQSYYGVQLTPNFVPSRIPRPHPGGLPELGLRKRPGNPLLGPGEFGY